MAPFTRRLLVSVLEFQRNRARLEARDAGRTRDIADRLEAGVKAFWRTMASLQSLGIDGAMADLEQPGYVKVPLPGARGDVLCVPFHLVPAAPDLPALREVLELAFYVRLHRDTGFETAICLSGSTVILRDVLYVGDIDFCEYVPAEAAPANLAEAFRRQVSTRDARYCAVSIRVKTPNNLFEELRSCVVNHASRRTSKRSMAIQIQASAEATVFS